MKCKTLALGLVSLWLVGCKEGTDNKGIDRLPTDQVAVFSSNNQDLKKTYDWARKMALSYAHDGSDSVGYWYEAALPQRESFCMRDVSHQTVGAQILGLDLHNKNMMKRFAENISESKDWCTYWEINRYNKPCPADYLNDNEFWYNLNANFDVMQACLKLYDWTADMDYLTDSSLRNFYEKTVNEYVERWMLAPADIMDRPRYMNQPKNFDPEKGFHACRGLASYVENFQGLAVGADLLATLYAGFKAYGEMNIFLNKNKDGEQYLKTAEAYRSIFEDKWWNPEINSYNTFWTEDHKFYRGEGVTNVLWFGISNNQERIEHAVKDVTSKDWNVENMSAFPMLFYRLDYPEKALTYMLRLPHMERSEYPEVSYGVIEGMVGGMMGIQPTARLNEVTTLSKVPSETTQVSIKNVPVFGGYISVEHIGYSDTKFTNNTGKEISWKAYFQGKYRNIKAGDKTLEPKSVKDSHGKTRSVVQVKLAQGETLHLQAIL